MCVDLEHRMGEASVQRLVCLCVQLSESPLRVEMLNCSFSFCAWPLRKPKRKERKNQESKWTRLVSRVGEALSAAATLDPGEARPLT